ncbi:hypothetical protein GUITHDRAFT_141392 [Guillardia theta CCMP2712]|uniref:Uncharacterized protein n=1 Tax=Guillardia theta (strain CCMP2712) TaxID=905079 RepID=L1J228_GUITC|nr:hypothetical protein GUITHDRAFT_141392 [Guillardia theta CCMP2712]EKX42189.1 hypothetical protein GUITHDRAFT_141392 [Guillardia theta CCMP2712]|eukprot:XP_005829169.1 hypothetical protein GUITHDRAFT_141392 [Guillardia theta CCMP2712]
MSETIHNGGSNDHNELLASLDAALLVAMDVEELPTAHIKGEKKVADPYEDFDFLLSENSQSLSDSASKASDDHPAEADKAEKDEEAAAVRASPSHGDRPPTQETTQERFRLNLSIADVVNLPINSRSAGEFYVEIRVLARGKFERKSNKLVRTSRVKKTWSREKKSHAQFDGEKFQISASRSDAFVFILWEYNSRGADVKNGFAKVFGYDLVPGGEGSERDGELVYSLSLRASQDAELCGPDGFTTKVEIHVDSIEILEASSSPSKNSPNFLRLPRKVVGSPAGEQKERSSKKVNSSPPAPKNEGIETRPTSARLVKLSAPHPVSPEAREGRDSDASKDKEIEELKSQLHEVYSHLKELQVKVESRSQSHSIAEKATREAIKRLEQSEEENSQLRRDNDLSQKRVLQLENQVALMEQERAAMGLSLSKLDSTLIWSHANLHPSRTTEVLFNRLLFLLS